MLKKVRRRPDATKKKNLRRPVVRGPLLVWTERRRINLSSARVICHRWPWVLPALYASVIPKRRRRRFRPSRNTPRRGRALRSRSISHHSSRATPSTGLPIHPAGRQPPRHEPSATRTRSEIDATVRAACGNEPMAMAKESITNHTTECHREIVSAVAGERSLRLSKVAEEPEARERDLRTGTGTCVSYMSSLSVGTPSRAR